MEIISRIFFNHNTMRLKINYKKKKNPTNTLSLTNMLLNNRTETIKLLEENIGSMLFDSGHHNFISFYFIWFVYSTKGNKSKI